MTRLGNFTAILMLTSAYASAGELKTHLDQEDGGATLAFYDASCGEDSWHECVVADVGCDKSGSFKASLVGLQQKDIAAWFTASDGQVAVKADAKLFELRASSIEFGELNMDWQVMVPDWGQGKEIWRAIKASKAVSLAAGKTVNVLPRKALSEVVKICVR